MMDVLNNYHILPFKLCSILFRYYSDSYIVMPMNIFSFPR